MNGAESLARTLVAAGVEVCFANPGTQPGPASKELFDISRPALDWVKLAHGMGVEAASVATLEGFASAFASACARRGPFLIEFLI